MKINFKFYVIAILLSMFISSCKKNEPDNNSTQNNSNIIYTKAYSELFLDGKKLYNNNDLYGGSWALNNDKTIKIYFNYKNDNDTIINTVNLGFSINEAVKPGIYSTALGNVSGITGGIFTNVDTYNNSALSVANFRENFGDNFKVTIDSVNKNGPYVILFGKFEGSYSKDSNPNQKVNFSQGRFWYLP